MAFKIAVSGLRAASAELDVTGNNISNANTVGFKKSRVQFADVYAVSDLGSTTDAIGQGVQLSAVSQQFFQGNISFTDNGLDLSINGEGFFVLDEGGTRTYSRAGAFGVDKDGFVVNPTGQRLVSFGAVNGAVTGARSPLQLNTNILAPQASANVAIGVNLDANDSAAAGVFDPVDATTYNNSTSLTVFDSLGGEHLSQMFFRKTATPNQWDTHLRVDADNTQTLATQTLNFNPNGQLTSAMPVGYGTFTPVTGASAFTLSVNFTGTTQVGASFGVSKLSQDGFTSTVA